MLAENDDEADMDPEVADELVKTQKEYAKDLAAKFKKRKKAKKAGEAVDDDFEAPTKAEMEDMIK